MANKKRDEIIRKAREQDPFYSMTIMYNELRAKYDELIYAVECKYEGETRHETALRYIRQAEAGCDDAEASNG